MQLILRNKALFAILFVALMLRFIGTNPGYNQFHADEGITYSAAVSMIKNGNLDPLRYDYPALVPDINYVFFKLIFIPLNWAKYYITHIPEIVDGLVHIPIAPLEEKRLFQVYVLGERNINALHWGRYVTAFISLLDVLLVYILARKLFSKVSLKESTTVGLIAAFLLTFNYKHVVNSHIGLPDIYNAFFVLLVLICCVNLWKKPTLKNYLIAGATVGLSFSVKYQIFALMPLLLTHLYLSFNGFKINFKSLFNPAIFAAGLMVPLVFALSSPYFFVHFHKALKIVSEVSLKYGMGTSQLNLYPVWYWYNIDYGPVILIAAAAGLVVSLKKYTKETLLLLSFLAPFFFVMLFYSRGGFYVRNFITSTPLLMIFAAITFWEISKLARNKLGQIPMVLVLAVILTVAVWIPGKNAIINSINYTRAWGYNEIRPWVDQNLPKDAVVASHPFDYVNLKIKNKRLPFDVADSWSLAEHREGGADYAVLDLNWAGIPFYFWMGYGLEDLNLYWNKPTDIMRNIYFGLATEEQLRYSIHFVSKPWQAPDTHISIVKIPSWPKVESTEIGNFSFDGDLNNWVSHGLYGLSDSPFVYDAAVGHAKPGSVRLIPRGSKFPTARISTQPIEVKGGHLYQIEGFLKTELLLTNKDREGFLRVDFYDSNGDYEKVGIISAVSPRVYGTTDWIKKEITERAPDNAKFMVVSFQVHITTKTTVWLDEVSIKESKEQVEDITAKSPYQKADYDLNYIYPNSHGNL